MHRPARTLQYAIAQAVQLNKMGMAPELVKFYVANLEADQICYGAFKNKVISGSTLYDIVRTIAVCKDLLPKDTVITSFSKKATKEE